MVFLVLFHKKSPNFGEKPVNFRKTRDFCFEISRNLETGW